MTDLVTWLRAQIDANEQGARAASPGGWTYGDVDSIAGGSLYDESRMIGSLHYEQPTDHDGRIVRHLLEHEADANGRHIAVHDPARVLHQVAAMRKIVDLHRSWADEPYRHPHAERYCQTCSDDDISWWTDSGSPEWPCPTLRLLTTVYADRDGYRPEWAPE